MVKFRRHSLCVLMLWLATAHAQSSPAPTTTDSPTEEDYAISSAALDDVFGKGKPEKLVLIDQTSIGFPPGMAAMTQFGGKAQPLLAQAPKDAKDQVDTRNKGHQKIDVGDSCDMLCGNGYFILLGKDGEQWKVLQKVMIWVS